MLVDLDKFSTSFCQVMAIIPIFHCLGGIDTCISVIVTFKYYFGLQLFSHEPINIDNYYNYFIVFE